MSLDKAKGSGSTWEDKDGDPRITAGSVVIIGKHRGLGSSPRDGPFTYNWNSGMNQFVGLIRVVREGGPHYDGSSCRTVRIHNTNDWFWRVRDLVYLGTTEDITGFQNCNYCGSVNNCYSPQPAFECSRWVPEPRPRFKSKGIEKL